MKNLRLFGLKGSEKYAKRVANFLDIKLAKHEERLFSDGEPFVKPDENVRGCDVYVISSWYSDSDESVCDKILKSLLFVGALVDASAGRITMVTPYMGLQRQDRKTASRAGIYTKYIPILLEAIRTDRLLALDVHSLAALQSGLRKPNDHLEAKNLLASAITAHIKSPENIVVFSPDEGAVKRNGDFREVLAYYLSKKFGEKIFVEHAFLDKKRSQGSPLDPDGKVSAAQVIGNVKGKKVIPVDDMITSGASMELSRKLVMDAGGEIWGICATHMVGTMAANEKLSVFDRIIVTDTIRPWRLKKEILHKILFVSTSELVGRAIKRTHEEGGSISDLLEDKNVKSQLLEAQEVL